MTISSNNRLLAPPITIVTSVQSSHSSVRLMANKRQPSSPEHDSPQSGGESVQSSTTSPYLSLRVPPSPTTSSLGGETLRSRSSSFVSKAESTRSRSGSEAYTLRSRYDGDELTAEEALQPDKNNDADFEVHDNPFAFSPGQLNKLLNPKSLAAYKALGGIRGLERGLKTDIVAGLSLDETVIGEKISFEEVTSQAKSKNSPNQGQIVERGHTTGAHEISGQYRDRLRVFKDNRLPAKKSLSIWMLLWRAFNDKILLLLTGAAAISLALGIYEAVGQAPAPGQAQSVDWVEGLAIMVAVILVVLVTGFNDYRREKQFVTLNTKKEDRQVKVVRSGKSILMSIYDITVGDVLHIESGDLVPADGILISGYGIQCDESSATGESDTMKKITGDNTWQQIIEGTASSRCDPFILSGSKVLEGTGTYLVTSVGVNSSHGKIMVSLQVDTEDTPLQKKLANMANWIGYIGSAVAGILFIILLIRFLVGLSGNTASPAMKGSQFLDILIVAITIIVVAVPEGLPVAVTLALSFATKRMLKEKNLVRHLRACETMGNATTICTDKTGTLTQNKMTVVSGSLCTGLDFAREAVVEDGEETVLSLTGLSRKLSPVMKDLLLQSIAINSTAFEGEEDGRHVFIGSKTESALLQLAKEQLGMGPVAEERAGVEVVHFFPFDSDRKCMGVVIRLSSGTYRLLVKGAAEILLAKATKELISVESPILGEHDLSPDSRSHASLAITTYAKQTLRTIALLFRDFQQWPPRRIRTFGDEKNVVSFEDILEDMTYLGIMAIQDPLRDGVSRAVKQCQDAGITVRMVTGDNITTATAIASQCGIMTTTGVVMEGPRFRQLTDLEMDSVMPNLRVLARSSPLDKQLLVSRLKHLGETVAVTGDGTNDAPALKAADIGFSMGIAGTEVAKEASSIILMDDNFSSIVNAIMWGRSVNDAVAKFLQFQVTVNITAVILAFVSAVASPSSHSVLSAVQLLWVNLIMDTFAALALATDAPTEKILNRKPSPKSAPLITTNMWKMILGQAAYQLAITFVLYFAGATILGYDFAANPELQMELDTIVFNTFVWMQIFNELNIRRLDNKFNIFEGIHKNYVFMGINVIMVAGQIMIVFVGGSAFQVKRIDGVQWAICLLCAAPCLVWAVALRCLPDAWVEVVFDGFKKTFQILSELITRAVSRGFAPIGKAAKSVRRLVHRARSNDGQSNLGQDEEMGVRGPVTNIERESNNPRQSAEERIHTAISIPPITLTTMD